MNIKKTHKKLQLSLQWKPWQRVRVFVDSSVWEHQRVHYWTCDWLLGRKHQFLFPPSGWGLHSHPLSKQKGVFAYLPGAILALSSKTSEGRGHMPFWTVLMLLKAMKVFSLFFFTTSSQSNPADRFQGSQGKSPYLRGYPGQGWWQSPQPTRGWLWTTGRTRWSGWSSLFPC